ncbi:MAG: NAD+ synthase [Ignavibacteriales bacterium]|nr:NAD+ synthase [Ignavibacteriales bacterium]
METSTPSEQNSLHLNTALVREVLVRFLRDQTTNADFAKVVIGISGGVDSALVAALAVDALGKENVFGVMMPHRSSNPKSLEDAASVVAWLGIRSQTIDISPMADVYCEANNVGDQLRRGNVMARTRMTVLYDLSARERALVIGTSNKTELLMGYGTQFGDLACALNPLGDLYKTQVWQLAEAMGIPEAIVRKKPSADLWEGQTDEGEMGFAYAELDPLLFQMIDQRRSDEELVKSGFAMEFVGKVKERVRKNQFKRRPPVIAKISYRTVNVDFRYVRDWDI